MGLRIYPASKKRSRNVPWRLYSGWQKTSFRVIFSERSENVAHFFHDKWMGEEFTEKHWKTPNLNTKYFNFKYWNRFPSHVPPSLFGSVALKYVPVILPACEHLDDMMMYISV